MRTRSNLLRLNGSSFGISEWLFLEEQEIAEDLESPISKIREGDDIDNEFNIVKIEEHEFQTNKTSVNLQRGGINLSYKKQSTKRIRPRYFN